MQFEINGRVIKTRYYTKVTKPILKQIAHIRKNYYVKDADAMRINMRKVLLEGGSQITAIYNFFFEEIVNDSKRYDVSATVNQVLANDECLAAFLTKIEEKHVFFSSPCPVFNMKQALRLGAISCVAKKLANFPLAPAKCLIYKYSLPVKSEVPVYVDTSCGWGVRMLAAAATGHNYVGFDVNPRLIKQLHKQAKEIQRVLPEWKYKIVEHGSELMHAKAIGVASFMLTSPPYYCLEEYQGAEQSYSQGMSYQHWCSSYLRPLMRNSYHYLRAGGYCLINIKDFKHYDLVHKTKLYGELAGLDFIGYESLKLGSIKHDSGTLNRDEPLLVFRKPHNKNKG